MPNCLLIKNSPGEWSDAVLDTNALQRVGHRRVYENETDDTNSCLRLQAETQERHKRLDNSLSSPSDIMCFVQTANSFLQQIRVIAKEHEKRQRQRVLERHKANQSCHTPEHVEEALAVYNAFSSNT